MKMSAQSSVSENGLTDLFTELCQLQLRGRKRAYFVQPDQSKDVQKKKLRKCLYNTLFSFLKNAHRLKRSKSDGQGFTERILAHALKLRLDRKFDEATQLEHLLADVTSKTDETSFAVLQFLSLLIDSSSVQTTPTLGHEGHKLPVVFADKITTTILPAGPRAYGDSSVVKPGDPYYMHYPRTLFESGTLVPDLQLNMLCTLTPGHGLSGNGFFSIQGNLNDTFERDTRCTLFGALIESTVTSLDVRLDLPDVANETDNRLFELKIPKCHELSEDEGFVSHSLGSSSSDSQGHSEVTEDDIWEQALHYVPSKHRTWETIGKVPGPTERPYLTEAGPQTVAEIYDQWQRKLSILDVEDGVVKRVEISQSQLVKHVINLLIGIPSTSFYFNEESDDFSLVPGVYISGLTPDTVEDFITEFLQAGTFYNRLSVFSAPPVVDSFYKKGLIFQAFCDGIRQYLQHYRAAVLSLPCDKSLFELKLHYSRIMEQIRFLTSLCKCDIFPVNQEDFPNGVSLISYVYRETAECVNTDHYPVMLSLMQSTVSPYCLFVQDWVFHGSYRDVYGEFMFEVNTDYLQSRDKRYWTRGYTLRSKTTEDNVPVFLSHLASEIFTCGKALNLLKLCNPKHFLCNVDDRETPQVMISFSETDLASLWSRCQVYVSRMQQVAKQVQLSREEKKRRAQEARVELMERAKEASMRDIARYQAKVTAYRKAVDIKKRKEFKELKEQMETDLQRRADEKAQEKSDDKYLMDRLTKREEMMDRKQAEIELQARAELIEMYAKLTEEAAQRERKALWRIERAKLAETRLQFLVQQEVAWRKELVESTQTGEQPNSGEGQDNPDGGELPNWVNKVSDGKTVIVTDTVEEPLVNLSSGEPGVGKSPLPKWAQQKLNQRKLPTLKLKTDDLPAWAVKGLESVDEDGVVVVAGSSSTPALETKYFPNISGSLNVSPDENGSLRSEVELLGSKETETVQTPEIPSVISDSQSVSVESDNEVLPADKTPQSTTTSEPTAGNTSQIVQKNVSNFSDTAVLSSSKTDAKNLSQGAQNVSSSAIESSSSEKDHSQDNFSRSKWRTQVKVVGDISTETRTESDKPHIHLYTNKRATIQSEGESEIKSSIKLFPQYQANDESAENTVIKSGIGMNTGMTATTESIPNEDTPSQIRTFGAAGISLESTGPSEGVQVPHLKRNANRHAGVESVPKELPIKKASIYGHVSQLSNMEFVIAAPKLRKRESIHVGMESDYKNFAVKSNIKFNKQMSATTESKETTQKSGIRMNRNMFSTKESDYVDVDAVRLNRFKRRNLHGHSSDSTIQRLLYGERFGARDELDGQFDNPISVGPPEKLNLVLREIPVEIYQDQFDFLVHSPRVDLLSTIYGKGRFGNYGKHIEEENSLYHFTPLSVLFKTSVTIPLLAQVSLVNDCVLAYFTGELQIDNHFQALRRYLFMGDGDFAQILSDMLFEKLSRSPRPKEMLNPVFLHGALTRSVRSSMHADDKYAGNISFALNYMPRVLNQNDPDCLDCLELQYKVDWPLNIIITEKCLTKYSKVFSFMLQLRRIVWVLKEVWYKLKGDAVIMKAGNSKQFRQLQLFRQEMQHFVKVMQGYIANQIIHVTWQEFQEALNQHVHNLDQLHRVHAEYLDMAIFRCLLNKKAEPVMKIIQNIFSLILKFRNQLISASWQKSSSGETSHPHFTNMVNTYQVFKEYSAFLFTVVNKLGTRGYQPHLHELLLRLNFNNYYKAS